jgi:peptidoglycan hydrolase-like protein with peptidoglycan-binding domain
MRTDGEGLSNAELIGRADFLELRCGRCERQGRLSVARLVRENPPETSLASIMRAQIGDCPKQTERRIEARCDPYGAHLTVDGRVGPRTEAALRNFQRQHNLPVTGRPDSETITALGIPCC